MRPFQTLCLRRCVKPTIAHGRYRNLAALTWIERRAAALLFGKPPDASYADAYGHLEAAERLDPGFWALNQLELAKACLGLAAEGGAAAEGKAEEARRWLTMARATAVAKEDAGTATEEDRGVAKEAAALARKHG